MTGTTLPPLLQFAYTPDFYQCVYPEAAQRQTERRAEIVEGKSETFTPELERLAEWLKEHKVKTNDDGIHRRILQPVWNVLERPKYGFELMLVNPAIAKGLQGHKTNRIDATRISEHLQRGLLHGSFIPPKPVLQMQELTRMRVIFSRTATAWRTASPVC